MNTRPNALVRAGRWTAGAVLAATLTAGGIAYHLATDTASGSTTSTASVSESRASGSEAPSGSSSSDSSGSALGSTSESAQTMTRGS